MHSQTLQVMEIATETYERLDAYVRILPGNNESLSAPFAGFVINLNVVTAAHRDSKDDDSVCLILAIGNFEGGEVVLYEPGLVIDLRPGDFILFPSSKLTHFNLHFQGRRASIVLHTDKELSKWLRERNGWASNSSFA